MTALQEDTRQDTLTRHYGKYRGTVVLNIDPEQRGRLIAQVPDVLGLIPSTWALPCAPFTGIQAGLFVVPPIGSKIWMEFEQGDPDFPIWTGGFWGLMAEVPGALASPTPATPAIPPGGNVIIQTPGQNRLMLSDAAPLPGTPGGIPGTGGITLRSPGGATIVVNDSGIFIDNGKGASIKMVGLTIIVNNGALTVT